MFSPNRGGYAAWQSEALAQHRLIGTWEVPDEKQKIAALKMLRRVKVTNIKVRVVKP